MLWSAFYNRFPFTYPDTNGYIAGDEMRRAIGYHFFIIFTALRWSLWNVVFAQALITTLLLMRISCIMLEDNKFKELIAFLILSLLILFTDVSKYASWLMPDIFTAWIFLGGVLFFISVKRHDLLFASAVIWLGLFGHISNIFTVLLFILASYVIMPFLKRRHPYIPKILNKLLAVTLVSLLSISALNYITGRGFSLFPPKKSVFLMAKFINYGMVSKTLNNYCPASGWQACQYKDAIRSMKGTGPNFILWAKDSPYVKYDIFKDEKEAQEIIMRTFKDNFRDITLYSLIETILLLRESDVGDGLDFPGSINDYPAIKAAYPDEFDDFASSRESLSLPLKVRVFQFQNKKFHRWVFRAALFLIIILLFKRRYGLLALMISLLFFIFLNALVTASISALVARYNMRVIWLIPFVTLLSAAVLSEKYFPRRKLNIWAKDL